MKSLAWLGLAFTLFLRCYGIFCIFSHGRLKEIFPFNMSNGEALMFVANLLLIVGFIAFLSINKRTRAAATTPTSNNIKGRK